jgi:hypothetical protein
MAGLWPGDDTAGWPGKVGLPETAVAAVAACMVDGLLFGKQAACPAALVLVDGGRLVTQRKIMCLCFRDMTTNGDCQQ